MKSDNKGYTLVELIAVIAMISILAGLGARNLGVLNSYRCRECKNKLMNSITETKMDCLSKSRTNTDKIDSADVYLEVKKQNNEIFVIKHAPGKQVGDDPIVSNPVCVSKGKKTELQYHVSVASGGAVTSSAIVLGNGSSFKVGFNRSTGALLPEGSSYIDQIDIITGNNTRTIKIQTKTGKVD